MNDDLPFDPPTTPQTGWATPKCRRHRWDKNVLPGDPPDLIRCARCHKPQDAAKVRQGRNNRSRGNRHELKVARERGGTKIGHLGGPGDDVLPGTVQTVEFLVQLKTTTGKAPERLLRLFRAMDVSAGGRVPIVVRRYLRPGQTPIDLYVVRGEDWAALFGETEP